MPDEYVIHGAPFSLFTRKLEAAFRFYDLPFRLENTAIGGDETRNGRVCPIRSVIDI